MEWWQHIPEYLDPIACTIGSFSLYWYAVFFFFGFLAALLFSLRSARRRFIGTYADADIFDAFLFLFLGAFLGGRLGYVVFYNLPVFLDAPLLIFVPYDFESGIWTGLSGMSYHGGLLGASLALFLFSRWKRKSFWEWADLVVLSAPIASFFGRLGNFFNGELPGRVTERVWGMYMPGTFPIDTLRHPSTLYQAFFEGVLVFLFLIFWKRRVSFRGELACVYLVSSAIVRFATEYFREPDRQIGLLFGILSLGQVFSIALLIFAVAAFFWLRQRDGGIISMKRLKE